MRLIERNPELVRNLWLELTAERLIIAPLLIGAGLALGWAANDPRLRGTIGGLMQLAALLVLVLWGMRRAGDGIREEQLAGTWDAQRMSGLSAWQLALGKLLGPTAFAWYLALCCLLLTLPQRALANGLSLPLLQAFYVLGLGFVAVACGILAGFTGQTEMLARRRRSGVGAIALLLLGMAWKPVGFSSDSLSWWDGSVNWWSIAVPRDWFTMLSLLLAVASALLTVQRRMRSELQERTLPVGWLSLLAVLYAWTGGFLWSGGESLLNIRWHGMQAPGWLLAAIDPVFRLLGGWTVLTAILSYLCYFHEARDPMLWRRTLRAARESRWHEVLASLPLWLLNAGVTLLLAMIATAWFGSADIGLRLFALALFVLRDLSLMSALTLGRAPRRAAAVPASVLLVLYVLLPLVLWLAGLGKIATLINPLLAWGEAPALLLAALAQTAAAVFWLRLRWRSVFAAS